MEQMADLYDVIRNWVTTSVQINGERVRTDRAWVPCFFQRVRSFVPELYCFGELQRYNGWGYPTVVTRSAFNPWGCMQLLMPLQAAGRVAPGWLPLFTWLSYGHLAFDGTFYFDKERIREQALKRANGQVGSCPAFRHGFVEAVANAFPDSVNPLKDGDWDYILFERRRVRTVSLLPPDSPKVTGITDPQDLIEDEWIDSEWVEQEEWRERFEPGDWRRRLIANCDAQWRGSLVGGSGSENSQAVHSSLPRNVKRRIFEP